VSVEALECFGKLGCGVGIALNGHLADVHELVVCLGYREHSRLDETRRGCSPERCKAFEIWTQEEETRITIRSVVVVEETALVRELCRL